MSDSILPMSATITLPSGSPASINLHDRERFELLEWNMPGVTYRLTEITGENQPGSIPVMAVRDTAVLSGTVQVLGTSEASLRANERLLYRALGQFRYTLTEVIDGNTHVYTHCRPADATPRGGADWDWLRSMYKQSHVFSIRCHPRTVG